jgi:hypothetical protein
VGGIDTPFNIGKAVMKIRRHIFGVILMIFAGLSFAYLAYSGIIFYKAERLDKKATKIVEGMALKEVTKTLGKPTYIIWVDSISRPNRTFVSESDKKRIEEIENKYQKLMCYGYQVSFFKLPFFRKQPVGTTWKIFFDDSGNSVVYVSWVIIIGD